MEILQEIGLCKIGYVNTIQYVALGILLEIPYGKMGHIVKLADVHIDRFIPVNPELEQIIPNEFRDEINQLLVDFSSLEDEDFWKKYNLIELWHTVDDYRKNKIDKKIIGNIVINQLVSLGYILQLDYKEDIEDYVDNMKNYWEDSDVKLIRFELDNDQNYYAKVPVSCKLKNVYEADIYE